MIITVNDHDHMMNSQLHYEQVLEKYEALLSDYAELDTKYHELIDEYKHHIDVGGCYSQY